MFTDFLHNKIACPVDGVRKRRSDWKDRPDFQEFFLGTLENKNAIIKNPQSVRVWNAKIREFEDIIQKCKNHVRSLYSRLVSCSPEMRGIYHCSIIQLEAHIHKLQLEIKKFEQLKRLGKTDDKTKLDVERARTVPISSFLMGQWRKTGSGRSTVLCPIVSEKTPSFVWFEEKNNVHCFSCGYHGDSIDLFMRLHACNFIDAVKELCKY